MIFEPQKYNSANYFAGDPVEVVRRFSAKRDIEVMGIVASWVAFGRRELIHRRCDEAARMMNLRPYDYLLSGQWWQYRGSDRCFYRMLTYADFYDLMASLNEIYSAFDTMEDALLARLNENAAPDEDPAVSLMKALLSLFRVHGIPREPKSACKRMALFLRWMVRRDGQVDLGVWQRVDPRWLLVPMDVHVVHLARELGLIERDKADMKAALELIRVCRRLYPDDPAIMDFALFTEDYERNNKSKQTIKQ